MLTCTHTHTHAIALSLRKPTTKLLRFAIFPNGKKEKERKNEPVLGVSQLLELKARAYVCACGCVHECVWMCLCVWVRKSVCVCVHGWHNGSFVSVRVAWHSPSFTPSTTNWLGWAFCLASPHSKSLSCREARVVAAAVVVSYSLFVAYFLCFVWNFDVVDDDEKKLLISSLN